MRLHKYEIIFLGYLLLLTIGGYLAFKSSGALADIIAVNDLGGAKNSLSTIQRYIQIVAGVICVSVIAGLLGIFPTIRRNAYEHGRLSEATESLTKKSETYQHAALTDPLTGLQNRRYFDDALDQYIEEFAAIGHPLGIIVLDLDHFKKINDTYGHDVGDEVLRGVTACLLDYTRYHDVVARIGGEEFAILAPNLDQRALSKLADRIRVAVSETTYNAENVTFRVTTSMGIALWDGTESSAAFVKRADKKLYQAKTNGRNRIAA